MSAPPELPEIVTRAFDVSRRAGYVSFCRNETGRLLAMLAATRDGTMAEFGTGCGVGTAWLRSGVRRDTARIVTAELDPRLAGYATEIFADDPQVEVLAVDWASLRDRGPFSLLFLDAEMPGDITVDKSPAMKLARVRFASSTIACTVACLSACANAGTRAATMRASSSCGR